MNRKTQVIILEKDQNRLSFLNEVLDDLSCQPAKISLHSSVNPQLVRKPEVPLAVLHLDIGRPRDLEWLQSIRKLAPNLGIIVLANVRSTTKAIDLLQQDLCDYILNPEDRAGIYSAMKREIERITLAEMNKSYRSKIRKLRADQKNSLKRFADLEEIHDSTLDNLMTALDLRDVETFGHSRTVAKYSQVLAQILGISDPLKLNNIRKGALLHDIGKIAIPDSILKKPADLTHKEWEKIRLHPSLGYGLIKDIKLVEEVGNIILYHHERFDGRGYPDKLDHESIPLEARIFALADTLDAITSHRPYRKKKSFSFARDEIIKNSGQQFDPDIVEAFCTLEPVKWEKIRFETTKLLPLFENLIPNI